MRRRRRGNGLGSSQAEHTQAAGVAFEASIEHSWQTIEAVQRNDCVVATDKLLSAFGSLRVGTREQRHARPTRVEKARHDAAQKTFDQAKRRFRQFCMR